MKYKALFLDIDGTVVANSKLALPTVRVTEAIRKASEKVHICLATGRPLYLAQPVIDHLAYKGFCITSDGTQIYDLEKKKIVREETFGYESLLEIYRVAKMHHEPLFINEGVGKEFEFSPGPYKPQKVLTGFIPELSKAHADEVMKDLEMIPSVASRKGVSWTDGLEFISISSPSGTKLHGITEVAKIFGIETHEMIGVGDGYNDFPLLMACGLKVAMGNAVPELKEIADYVAPSVSQDGVADVIEKYILTHE